MPKRWPLACQSIRSLKAQDKGENEMNKLLVVDDDEAMRKVIRLNLADSYEVIDTGEPEHALALALEHKPDAILLDLRMPKYSGFELCQTRSEEHTSELQSPM